jgi:hypothetical protein
MLMCGCFANINYYPCAGPAFKERPIQVIRGRIYGNKSGAIHLVFSSGETYDGKWSLGKENESAESIWPKTWDKAYGEGFYEKKIAHNDIGTAEIKMANGNTIHTRFRLNHFSRMLEGIAVDDFQNTYVVGKTLVHFEYKGNDVYMAGGK